jgi:RNA polymerase sigma-70 factor (ECF subfamily)
MMADAFAAALPGAAIIAPVDGSNSDEALMAAYQGGDARSFALLFERYERQVFRFLRRSLGDATAADDLLQEVWLAVVRNAAGYVPRAKFTTWLFTIARSKLIDHWRAATPMVSLDAEAANDPDEALLDSIAAGAHVQPEVQAMSRAQAQAFLAAVESLPAVQREAFLLHIEGDMTVEEVAQATGVGFETAKSRLRYAFGKLRAAMEVWQ